MPATMDRPMQGLNKETFFADLGYRPHAGQQQIHNSRAPRRIVACGVRWGKTLCAAMEGLAAAMEPKKRSIGWIAAPTYDLADKVFRELVVLIAEHLRHRIVTLRERDRTIVLRNMSGGLMTEWRREIAVATRIDELEKARQEIDELKQEIKDTKGEIVSQTSAQVAELKQTGKELEEATRQTEPTSKEPTDEVSSQPENSIKPPSAPSHSVPPAASPAEAVSE